MDFKSLLSSLDQLSEATEKTKTGLKHTAEPGGYGRKDDEDEEGNKVKQDAPKRGRGRPKKDADASGEVKKYDFSAFGVKSGKDVKLKPWDKNKTTKHSLKEYFDSLDKAMNEAEQIEIKPASQTQTQVIKQGNKTLGTVTNPQLAQQIKQSIGKGEMSLAGSGLEESDDDYSAKKARAGKDIGKPGKQFAKIAKDASKRYGSKEAGERVAGAVLAKLRSKMDEADIPSDDSDMGAGLGAGRSQDVLEGSKPDFLDLDKDGNKKESMKKAAKDKKAVKESMENRLKAAHHRGKAHALAKESYNNKYDDMEESRMYHEGYKQGLDECYGQMPIQGMVDENNAVVDDMASFGAHTPALEAEIDEMDKGDWMKHKAKTTPGDTFKAFGQSFKDKDVLETDSMFESWDNQLSSLLEEYDAIQEGVSISSSTGNQGAPDSVTISATDSDAAKVLSIIKQLGLGAFGDEQQSNGYGAPMTVDTHGHSTAGDVGTAGSQIDVVGDNDGMMGLLKKITGIEGGSHDYEEEGGSHHDHEHTHEETCNECGMMESGCECDDSKEKVEEVESEDQMEYEVAEDNAPDSDAAETTADENAEAAEDQALATVDAAQDEEQVTEWANDAGERNDDEKFNADIDFMTKVISGGLNKQKSTGQTTIPVVASQLNRQVAEGSDSVGDWKKLAGIK